MPLETGTQLGPYEILSPLGAGGMGEVYKARDTRLDRPVAIKVLLAHVADDPDLRQRFERDPVRALLFQRDVGYRETVTGEQGTSHFGDLRTLHFGLDNEG